jgi:uncharacterized protein YggT (Ycf19 family)
MTIIPQDLSPFLSVIWQIVKSWWWVALIFILWRPFMFMYVWWRQQRYDETIKRIVLEIKMPKEVLRPIKAMEDAFAGFHSIHDVFTWREVWIEGQFILRIALEIASIDGQVHFFIRTPQQFRGIIESNVYAQYPEAEITEVPDYAKEVPQDIPNKDWDMWGTDEINTKPDPYPIKTYPLFESETQTKEEKRIDPLSGLLEGMATLGPGEQMWIQIVAKPIREEKEWIKEGLAIRDKLVRRPEKPKQKPMIQEAAEILISGPPSPVKEEKELIPPEMKLSPGEREIVSAIEQKIGKFGYDCSVRYIYLGKRDVFFRPRARIPFGFFKDISSENMGGLKPDKRTLTKVKSPFFWFLDKRRIYLKKRRLFKRYVKRVTPYWPRAGGTFVLNTEELATLFHFPGRQVAPAPSVPRIEAKKGEAPPGLPIE